MSTWTVLRWAALGFLGVFVVVAAIAAAFEIWIRVVLRERS